MKSSFISASSAMFREVDAVSVDSALDGLLSDEVLVDLVRGGDGDGGEGGGGEGGGGEGDVGGDIGGGGGWWVVVVLMGGGI
jgi:hypothetical protein